LRRPGSRRRFLAPRRKGAKNAKAHRSGIVWGRIFTVDLPHPNARRFGMFSDNEYLFIVYCDVEAPGCHI